MFTEAVSSGAVPGKAPGGGAGRCSSANGGFSALLNKIFTPGLSAAPVSLKEERASSRGMKGRVYRSGGKREAGGGFLEQRGCGLAC